MTRALLVDRGSNTAMKQTDAWAKFTTVELETKFAELQKLVDSGMMTDRSLDHQFTEIAFIERELATRDGG
jgi:hypothetical protein